MSGKKKERRPMLQTVTLPGSMPHSSGELSQIFQEHHNRIFRTAYRITGNADDAEDVLQTVFLRLIKRETSEFGNPESYLYRAAINASLDVLRSRKSAASVSLEDSGVEATHGRKPAWNEMIETQRWLRRAVSKLSEKNAEIFVMKFLEGYDNREIAQVLGTSSAVVAVTLFRIKSQLKKDFEEYQRGTGYEA
jgi:RNA polymerase sigma-70 factor (ECF subfamily)